MATSLLLVGAVPTPSEAASPIGDTITLVAWAVLGVLSLRLVWQLPASRRGAWCVVAIYCVAVAIDKLVDLQMVSLLSVRWCLDVLDPWLGLRQHRLIVRVVLVLLLAIIAVGGTVTLVRRDRDFDAGKKLAISGLILVLLFVTGRMMPVLATVLSESVCWVLEGLACLLIAIGLRLGFTAE